ncbi:hypothetical protein ACH19I_00320 [Yersinia kristensenii]|uniref:hypothetical protein n=1 Tax=Yersinia kristensenii TaxID=28152 RepID=UPI003896BA0D
MLMFATYDSGQDRLGWRTEIKADDGMNNEQLQAKFAQVGVSRLIKIRQHIDIYIFYITAGKWLYDWQHD